MYRTLTIFLIIGHDGLLRVASYESKVNQCRFHHLKYHVAISVVLYIFFGRSLSCIFFFSSVYTVQDKRKSS